MRARVKRVKRRGDWVFEFYLELPGYLMLLMAARKLSRAMTTYFALSLTAEEISRDSPSYIGKLRATNLGGTDWVLYDHGLSSRDATGAGEPTRRVLLALAFARGISTRLPGLASGPPQLVALIPGGHAAPRVRSAEDGMPRGAAADPDGPDGPGTAERVDCAVYLGASEADGPLLERWRRRDAFEVAALESKDAEWDEELQAYTLAYDGRAQRASVKNIQLVDCAARGRGRTCGESGASSMATGSSAAMGATRFQMGKLAKDLFTVDWTTPLSPMAAFGLALAICETPSQLSVALSKRGRRSKSDAAAESTAEDSFTSEAVELEIGSNEPEGVDHDPGTAVALS